MNVQRYTWLDAIIEAEATEKINKEANTAHRLAHAITWEPSDGRPSGLYWANELAADVCGVPRATFYRHIKVLKAEGFFTEEKGNLLPALPESQNETRELFEQRRQALVDAYNAEAKSHNETKTGVKTGSSGAKSHNDTSKSQNETGESQNDNPYSVDTYPVDEYTVEEKTTAVADAPSVPSNLLVKGSGEVLEDTEELPTPPNSEEPTAPLNSDVDDTAKSQNETDEEDGEMKYFFNRGEENWLAGRKVAHSLNDEQYSEVRRLVASGEAPGRDFNDRVGMALELIGVDTSEW